LDSKEQAKLSMNSNDKTNRSTASDKIFANGKLFRAIMSFKRRTEEKYQGASLFNGINIDTILENELRVMAVEGMTPTEIEWYKTKGHYFCWDTSCDGNHCPVCGGHKMDFYAPGPCSMCDL
jgi:hypothetical protein